MDVQMLLKNNPSSVVLIRETTSHHTAISTFDYNDLNAYLLVVVGLAQPEPDQVDVYASIAMAAQAQKAIPLRDIQVLCRKEELVALPTDATLDMAMETFGSGIHRVLVTKGLGGEVIGIVSQLRLLEFFWNEGVNFPAIERLYGALLRDLHIGSHRIFAVK
jgi:CBS domain-containing protein